MHLNPPKLSKPIVRARSKGINRNSIFRRVSTHRSPSVRTRPRQTSREINRRNSHLRARDTHFPARRTATPTAFRLGRAISAPIYRGSIVAPNLRPLPLPPRGSGKEGNRGRREGKERRKERGRRFEPRRRSGREQLRLEKAIPRRGSV